MSESFSSDEFATFISAYEECDILEDDELQDIDNALTASYHLAQREYARGNDEIKIEAGRIAWVRDNAYIARHRL